MISLYLKQCQLTAFSPLMTSMLDLSMCSALVVRTSSAARTVSNVRLPFPEMASGSPLIVSGFSIHVCSFLANVFFSSVKTPFHILEQKMINSES